MTTKTEGAKEWGVPRNICLGCSNDCGYCYAKAAASRFGWKEEPWAEMKLVPEKIQKRYRKAKSRIMFPTSHDITPEIVNAACYFIKKLLLAGNDILIVTKGDREVLSRLREVTKKHRAKVEFRFTITTFQEALAKQYEPGAPKPNDRLLTLIDTKLAGFRVSVSNEPFLSDPIDTVLKLYSLVDSIWVGPMNNVPLSSTPQLINLYTPHNLERIHRRLTTLDNGYGRIHFKDAFLNRMNGDNDKQKKLSL